MVIDKPKTKSAKLPATLVTPEVRQKVEDVAKANNVSIGHVQRLALDLFLAINDSNAIASDSHNKQENA